MSKVHSLCANGLNLHWKQLYCQEIAGEHRFNNRLFSVSHCERQQHPECDLTGTKPLLISLVEPVFTLLLWFEWKKALLYQPLWQLKNQPNRMLKSYKMKCRTQVTNESAAKFPSIKTESKQALVMPELPNKSILVAYLCMIRVVKLCYVWQFWIVMHGSYQHQ